MKKMIALISSCLLFAGVKAQTGAPVSKETTKPTVTAPTPVPSPALAFSFTKQSPHYFGTTVTAPPKK